MGRKFSMFRSAKAQVGEVCTHNRYLAVTNSNAILELCQKIAAEPDANKRGELKKGLPVVTWQSYFPSKRLAKEAEPSGLFMLDIDHVDDPWKLYSERMCNSDIKKELGIVFVGKTASCHGLRIVAKCRPGLKTIADCQRWLASNLKVDYDGVCKDWARCSFLVHDSYTYYMDAQGIWGTPEEGEVYENELAPKVATFDEGIPIDMDYDHAAEILGLTPSEEEENDGDEAEEEEKTEKEPKKAAKEEPKEVVDQREGLFGGTTEYKGIPLADIAKEWLLYTGGEPEEGERNNRLYRLALQLRYISDFNEATLLRVMPRYGLLEEEMKGIIHSACTAKYGQNIPTEMQETLNKIDRKIKLLDDDDEGEIPDIITDTNKMPPLPPVIKQWVEIAPDDFKMPCVLVNLPILGALGSRLRAEYLDGKLHSPSFMVSLEAPQASGKSFVASMVDYELDEMMKADEAQRELEKAYNEKVAEMKMLNIKVNADNKNEILGTKPKSLIRYLPPTISITKLFQRMDDAQGLHTFCYAPEVDTVRKAHSRGFSNLSDLLRMGFDNDLTGQDYASENSFSGTVRVFYNCVYTGTPKAMRKFYPDVEDGLVSRILFVTLADQFGKPMPVWGTFTPEQKRIVDFGLTRLNEVTLQGSDVQPEHIMKMAWLNKSMQRWITAQQIEAVNQDDRTRDIFCRRSAVVGFRAGMLAWFLYEEKNTPPIRRNVMKFAEWVANCMLNQHLLRFNVQGTGSNVNRWEDILAAMGDEFTRVELERELRRNQVDSPIKTVLYKWKLANLIESVEEGRNEKGQKQSVKFKKVRK